MLKRALAGLAASLQRLLPGRRAGLAYWRRRAARYGARAVLNLAHSEAEASAVTTRQKQILLPLLAAELRPEDRVVLDFGCGPGRFTPELARLTGRAIGVDPVREFLQIAEAGPGVEYRLLEGGRIPLEAGEADVLWICLVLGAVPDGPALAATRQEVERVLKPGGLVFLVENTTRMRNRRHWSYRPVAEYQALLPAFGLRHVTDYEDAGETISVLAGRSEPR